MLGQNHRPDVFLWHWYRVQEADTEFSRVNSWDFHAVINDQHIEEDAGVWGFIMWRSGGPRIIWCLRQRLTGCQTACEIATSPSSATNQSIFFATTNSDSSSMTQCDEFPPSTPSPSSAVQNSFLEASMFLFFYRWHQMNWWNIVAPTCNSRRTESFQRILPSNLIAQLNKFECFIFVCQLPWLAQYRVHEICLRKHSELQKSKRRIFVLIFRYSHVHFHYAFNWAYMRVVIKMSCFCSKA